MVMRVEAARYMSQLTVVIPEQQWGDVRWSVQAGWEQLPGIGLGLMTVASWETADAKDMAGFDGPALHRDRLISAWRGSSSGLPDFLLIRARADVASVVAVDSQGGEHPYPMSAVVEGLDLRFGGMPWPSNLVIDHVRVSTKSGQAVRYSERGIPLDQLNVGLPTDRSSGSGARREIPGAGWMTDAEWGRQRPDAENETKDESPP